jgi:hypothetical protein
VDIGMANSTADNLDKNIFWPRISATKKRRRRKIRV